VIAGLLGQRGRQMRSNDRIMVHDAYIPSDRAWIYHLAADIAVFPYRRVSQSGALITAMGYGLPVIVTDVGGLPETLDGNGWVVPPGDSISLAERLIEAMSDPSRLKSLGARSRELIDERHAPQLVAMRMAALYSEAIHSCSVSSLSPTA
jgi:glycosyltransferase involved in cell wall biosynthesis